MQSIGLVQFDIEGLSTTTCTVVVLVCLVVTVSTWACLYHPVILAIMEHAAVEAKDDFEKRAEHICVRMHLYELMARKTWNTSLFLLLSETVTLPVMTNLLKVLSCSYEDGPPTLRDAPDVACWGGLHSCMAVVAVLCIYAYAPTTMFGAAFMLADSDGIFAGKGLDIL